MSHITVLRYICGAPLLILLRRTAAKDARCVFSIPSAMATNRLASAFFLTLWMVAGASFKYVLDDEVEQAHTR